MARAYPNQYAAPWQLEDGSEVLIRPIRAEDEPAVARFHATLSERSVYLRYFHMMKLDARTAHERLARVCRPDYDREMVLVAETEGEVVGVARLVKSEDPSESEFAVLISDTAHGHGLGTELVRRLVEIARAEGVRRIVAEILPENDHMLRLCKMLGFELRHTPMEHVVHAVMEI